MAGSLHLFIGDNFFLLFRLSIIQLVAFELAFLAVLVSVGRASILFQQIFVYFLGNFLLVFHLRLHMWPSPSMAAGELISQWSRNSKANLSKPEVWEWHKH